MATSERKLAANRANAQRSTGPRTDAGKRTAARNAIVHGLTARAAVLHGDDVRQFRQFARRIFDELRPDGAMQVQLTEEIINYSWRLRRVPAAEESLFLEHHTFYKPRLDPDEEDDDELLEVDCEDPDDEDGEERLEENMPVGALCSMIEDKSWRGKPRSPVLLLDRYAARLERARASALRMLLALQRRKLREEDVDAEDEEVDDQSQAVAEAASGDARAADLDVEETLTSQNEPTASDGNDQRQVNVFNGDVLDAPTGIPPGESGTKPTAEPRSDSPYPVEPTASIGESPPATT